MPKTYKNILVALKLNHPDDQRVIAKTRYLQSLLPTLNTYLIHGVENVIGYGVAAYGIIDISPEIEITLMKNAAHSMHKIAQELNVPAANQILEFGSAKNIILDAAEKQHIDLIIIGQRSQNALSLLLGSTANAILHHAKCDVLAVHIH